jgi:DNA-binding CsgD family transcriptional regulator
MLEAFEIMHCGGILLDASGTVIAANARARQSFGSHLDVVQGALRAPHAVTNSALGRLIASVLHRGPAHDAPAMAAVAVPRDGRHPLIVHAVPLVASARDLFKRGSAVLLIGDPSEQVESEEALLRHVYGLTGAEARLAKELASGRELHEIASQSGVSLAKLRSQLKAVFGKTSTHRQSQLVGLLVRLSPMRP